MLKIFRVIAGLFVMVFLILYGAPASSQMRPNVPEVLAPPVREAPPDPEPIINRFRQANSSYGKPRMLIFWNRSLSDEVAARYQASLTLDARAQFDQTASASSSYSEYGSNAQFQQEANTSSRFELAESNQRIDEWARVQLEELTDWEIQGAFTNTMVRGGARLIDRNMIIRTTGKDATSNEEVNTYALETESMMGKADLLMEILLAAAQDSPTGVAFRITVKDINTGEIITMVSTPAEPPATRQAYYAATSTGFIRQEETTGDGLTDVGRTLALETMTALSLAWGQ